MKQFFVRYVKARRDILSRDVSTDTYITVAYLYACECILQRRLQYLRFKPWGDIVQHRHWHWFPLIIHVYTNLGYPDLSFNHRAPQNQRRKFLWNFHPFTDSSVQRCISLCPVNFVENRGDFIAQACTLRLKILIENSTLELWKAVKDIQKECRHRSDITETGKRRKGLSSPRLSVFET